MRIHQDASRDLLFQVADDYLIRAVDDGVVELGDVWVAVNVEEDLLFPEAMVNIFAVKEVFEHAQFHLLWSCLKERRSTDSATLSSSNSSDRGIPLMWPRNPSPQKSDREASKRPGSALEGLPTC